MTHAQTFGVIAQKVTDDAIDSAEEVLRAEEVDSEGVLLHAGKKHLRKIVLG
jgi:hypothetical protein